MGSTTITFPNESSEYRAARERLLAREVELRRVTEEVAVARRALPAGGKVPEDYVFEGATGPVRLSELFKGEKRSLAIYCFMFPRDPSDTRPGATAGQTAKLALNESPCPSCTSLLDQLDGAVEHVSQLMNLAVVARAPFDRLRDFGQERGWKRLNLLSGRANTFSRDYFGETREGFARPMMNVFHRDDEGVIRHFWGSELLYAPTDTNQDPRHVGTLEPVWNLLDLTPEGRPPTWDEQIDYCCNH